MTDKQFPPAQALRAVPLEEAKSIGGLIGADIRDNQAICFTANHMREIQRLVEFVEQFRPLPLPSMSVMIGSLSEIKIQADEVDEEQINLVRLNGRVFSPEIIEVDGGEDELPCVRILDEDDLTLIIDDTLGPDWTARLAARAIHAELYGKGEE